MTMCFNSVLRSNFNTRLPREIKDLIFADVCCINTQGTEPIVLGSVCKEWYNIIRSTPRLWSTITTTLFTYNRCHHQKQLFNLYLKFSKNLPLSISINLHSLQWSRFVDSMPEEVVYTLKKTKEVGHKLKYLDVSLAWGGDGAFYDAFIELTQSHLPVLEKVKLENFHMNRFPYANMDDIFCNSPQLRIMTLSCMDYEIENLASYTQITDLRLRSVSVQSCLEAMYFLPNLTHMFCDRIFNERGQDIEALAPASYIFRDGSEVIVHSSLLSLKIEYANPDVISLILQSILCPVLHTLHLHSDSWAYYTGPQIKLLQPLVKFIKDSGCQLDTLMVEIDTMLNDNQVWPLLDCINVTIENLHLKDLSRSRINPFSLFIQKLSSPMFLPQLRELRICAWKGPYDYSAVLQALRMRRDASTSEGVAQLTLFEGSVDRLDHVETDRKVFDGFENLKQNGMDVSFKVMVERKSYVIIDLITDVDVEILGVIIKCFS
ncbi:hypothetical protein BDQ17DRAFT_159190 [Cyathus striatus]|nr:hypothetical protein BDQ17DRAFT_159190 [Cyathus striatus]